MTTPAPHLLNLCPTPIYTPQTQPHAQLGHIKLGDFGVAAKASQEGAVGRGSPDYQAPEAAGGWWGCLREAVRMLVLRNFGAAWSLGSPDARAADVYSLGITILELMLPRAAFQAALPLIRRGKWVPPPCLASRHPDLADLLLKMLAVKPQHRPSMQEVRAHPFFSAIDWAHLEVYGAAGAPQVLLPLIQQSKAAPVAEAAGAEAAGATTKAAPHQSEKTAKKTEGRREDAAAGAAAVIECVRRGWFGGCWDGVNVSKLQSALVF